MLSSTHTVRKAYLRTNTRHHHQKNEKYDADFTRYSGWAGVPTGNALDGLSKQERPGQSAVVKLTFVASFVVPEGASLQDYVREDIQNLWNIKVICTEILVVPETKISTGRSSLGRGFYRRHAS